MPKPMMETCEARRPHGRWLPALQCSIADSPEGPASAAAIATRLAAAAGLDVAVHY